MSSDPREHRIVHVHYPWAWCWFHPQDLIAVDPDVTDKRGIPRPISTVAVDWSAVLDAVRHAISRIQPGREVFRQASVAVELPMPLGDLEYALVTSWVGADSPVSYWYEEDSIRDGRHRLWLTRPFAGTGVVPVLSENLLYLEDALAGGVTAATLPTSLEDARSWWDDSAAAVSSRSQNVDHRRQLTLAYLELTDPAPLLARWFPHLHPWDAAFPELVSLYRAGRADEGLLRMFLPGAWRSRQDHDGISPGLALSLFRMMAGDPSGFTVLGRSVRRPTGQLRLFRGATHANRAGVAWSTDPQIANQFAQFRQAPGCAGTVWTARVPAERLLAFFPDENEYIVDLTGAAALVEPAGVDPRPERLTTYRTRRLRNRSRW